MEKSSEKFDAILERAQKIYDEAIRAGFSGYAAHVIFEDEIKEGLGWVYDETSSEGSD